MRVLSGWFLLFALFAVASAVHHGWTRDLQRERVEFRAVGDGRVRHDRARVVIGRLAGTTPLAAWPTHPAWPAVDPSPLPGVNSGPDGVLAASPLDALSDPRLEALAMEPNLPPWTPVFEVTVRPGQVLSRICEDFYGTGRPPLPALVARYNGLADEHSLRAGQNLQLPPRERLDEP